ncbi:hypothetical protein L5220_11370 [Synechococcus sp. PCC 6716]|nr:hypothetical protein [Synechococcus sp. PCC 6716]
MIQQTISDNPYNKTDDEARSDMWLDQKFINLKLKSVGLDAALNLTVAPQSLLTCDVGLSTARRDSHRNTNSGVAPYRVAFMLMSLLGLTRLQGLLKGLTSPRCVRLSHRTWHVEFGFESIALRALMLEPAPWAARIRAVRAIASTKPPRIPALRQAAEG